MICEQLMVADMSSFLLVQRVEDHPYQFAIRVGRAEGRVDAYLYGFNGSNREDCPTIWRASFNLKNIMIIAFPSVHARMYLCVCTWMCVCHNPVDCLGLGDFLAEHLLDI